MTELLWAIAALGVLAFGLTAGTAVGTAIGWMVRRMRNGGFGLPAPKPPQPSKESHIRSKDSTRVDVSDNPNTHLEE